MDREKGADRFLNFVFFNLQNEKRISIVYDKVYYISYKFYSDKRQHVIDVCSLAHTWNPYPGIMVPDYENDERFMPGFYDSALETNRYTGDTFLEAANDFAEDDCFNGLCIMELLRNIQNPECISIH